MSKPLFACTVCGADFTRKSSAHRHKDDVHNGQCNIVRFVDYVIGRVSGIYPLPIMPRRLLSKKKTSQCYFPDHIHNQQSRRYTDGEIKGMNHSHDIFLDNAQAANHQYTRDHNDRPDPIDSTLTSLRKIVEFKEIFQQVYSPQPTPQAKITNQNYRDTIEYIYKSERPRIKNQDEDVIDNVIKFGKKLLEFKNLVQISQSTTRLQNNNLPIATNLNFIRHKQASQNDDHGYNDQDKITKIFGFRICICNSCQDCIPVPVFYPGKNDEVAAAYNERIDPEFFHQCGPEDSLVSLSTLDKTNVPGFIRRNLAELLNQVLVGSAQKRWKYLMAIPLSNPPEKENIIKLNNPENQHAPLTFSYYREKHVRLDLDKENDSKTINGNSGSSQHWAERAMTDAKNELSNEEVSEFLQLIKTATFAFFTIKRKGSYYYYLMALSNPRFWL
jgi:hypothetical protein